MKTKPLYILIGNGGDGSYNPKFTFNSDVIAKLEEADANDLLDYESCHGCDGDGFHFTTLNVPTSCTVESLGLNSYSIISDDYADKYAVPEEDEE